MKYQRMIIARHGGPEVLEMVEGEAAQPLAGQVRVKVLAAGVAFADILMRRGLYPGAPHPPFTPGYDLVGVVEEVGSGVSEPLPGRRVAALTVTGSYAQQVILPASELVPVPDGIEHGEAAALPLNYVTAYQLLHRVARVQPGQRVLVHGAAGGVGTALLQLGRLAGLELYGTASGAKHDVVRRYGAIPIDYQKEDFVARVEGGVEAVFDGVGGQHLWRSARALRRKGRLVCYGFSSCLQGGRPRRTGVVLSGANVGLINLIPGKTARLYAIASMKKRHPDWYRQDLLTLLELLAAGRIRPVVAERLPLAEAAKAHDLLERSAVSGKLVLLPHP